MLGWKEFHLEKEGKGSQRGCSINTHGKSIFKINMVNVL